MKLQWLINWLTRITNFQLALLLLGGSLLLYGPALTGDFIYDDHLQVEQNVLLASWKNTPELFQRATGFYTKSPANYYRPLHMVAYQLIHALTGGKPWGYHLGNILLYVGLTMAIFIWLRREGYGRVAPVAAILFMLNPIHVEAVAWIAALPELLGALFVLCLVILHRTYNWRFSFYPLAGSLFLAALLTRENTVVFPLLALLFDWFFSRIPMQAVWRKQWPRYTTYALAFLLYMVMRRMVLGFWLTQPGLHYPMSLDEYLLNGLYLLAQDTFFMLVPPGYSGFHVFHPVYSLLQKPFLLAASWLLGLGFLARWLYSRNRSLAAFYLWVPVSLIPFFNFTALGENIFAERYLYLASVGVAVLLAVWLVDIWERMASSLWKSGWIVGVGMLCLFGMAATWQRAHYWKNDLAFYQQSLKHDPDAYHFWNLLATGFWNQGNTARAIEILQRLDQLAPVPGKPLDYTAVAALPGEHRIFRQAYFQAQENLAVMYSKLGKWSEAENIYSQLAGCFSENPGYFLNAGLCQEKNHKPIQARQSFLKVLQLIPNQPIALEHLQSLPPGNLRTVPELCEQAQVLTMAGRFAAAEKLLQQAARLEPMNPKPHHYLFNVYWLTRQPEKARAANWQALQRDPQNQLYQYNAQALQKSIAAPPGSEKK